MISGSAFCSLLGAMASIYHSFKDDYCLYHLFQWWIFHPAYISLGADSIASWIKSVNLLGQGNIFRLKKILTSRPRSW